MTLLVDSATSTTDEFLFAEETPAVTDEETHSADEPSGLSWKLAIIDDDEVVHDVTRMVLADYTFKDQPLEIYAGHSGADARRILDEHPDIAVVILDVVMETETAGLDAVEYIREVLDNQMVRIILRTGQPGQAPEHSVISNYDINDYKEKADLTAQKLITSVTTALRAYDDMLTIQQLATSNEHLELLVQERTKELSVTNKTLEEKIQDRIKALEELRRNQVLLAEAQRIACIGNFEWNRTTNEMSWSDQIYRVLGLNPQRVSPSYETLVDAIYDEDRGPVSRTVEAAVSNQLDYDIEHRIVNPDGEIRYVRQQGEVCNDGEQVRVVGTLQDVTQMRSADEQMKKLSTAIEQTADSVMITDKNGVIEYINMAFTAMTGYEKKDVLGKTPSILKSGKQSRSFYRRLWNTISRGEVFSDIVINRRCNGTYYYEEKTITPQKNCYGQITHYISTGKDITERMLNQERLNHLAHHDSLTGLPNRTLLLDRLEQAMARTRWHERKVAVMFLDMDRFKVINDSLGHDFGDKLLKSIAERLCQYVRDGDTIARLGGDEFAVVLNDVASIEDVSLVVDKIIDSMQKPFDLDGRELFITTSIGVALFPDDGDNGQALLKKADVAMYHAKATGKNNAQFYSDEDESKALEKLSLETCLRHALEREEFFLQYQPQLHLSSGRISGLEALLRWRHPDNYVVPPLHFIPLLEETGMIISVGEWVLRNACLQEKQRQDAGLTPHRVAVNISIHQFRQKGFVKKVEAILNETKLEPSCLELEVTEGVFIDNMQATAEVISELHELGVHTSIDDFGTGYSSMNYLRRLPFDALKIDRSFVKDVNRSKDDAAITSAIITLAHSMGMEVIAEGVETVGQLDFLSSQGCDAIQGFWYSPPLDFEKIKELTREDDNQSQ